MTAASLTETYMAAFTLHVDCLPLASRRCFNCGSYGHSMRECWKELNRELVEERKR